MARGEDGRFEIGELVGGDGWLSHRVDHAPATKTRRPLRVYAVDPSFSRLDGAIATVMAPFEDLTPGPTGLTLAVDPTLPNGRDRYQAADLDHPDVLRTSGYEPDSADARFHGQMVYAVGSLCREAFCRALGRTIGWAFTSPGGGPAPLIVRPFGMEDRNAYYSRDDRMVTFGYFRSDGQQGRFPAGKFVFTSLSSDVVVHEFTHALLDSVRPDYVVPTNPDLAAFHESFADLMSLFQRFNYPELVKSSLRRSRGRLIKTRLFSALAPEFAQGAGLGLALRTFKPEHIPDDPLSPGDPPEQQYGPGLSNEPHERGQILTEAVLEAFAFIVQRRIEPFLKIATGGTGVLPEGDLPADLLDMIVKKTIRIAGQFRSMCIRALDYCPVTDLNLGDYLRALLTADAILIPDDVYGYREALVSAFRRRSLYPDYIQTMSESSLRWSPPDMTRALRIPGLALSELRFSAEPASPPTYAESRRQAAILGRHICGDPALAEELGLVLEGASADPEAEYGLPTIADIRPTRRIGPDGQVGYDLVAQVIQKRRFRTPYGKTYDFTGGSSLMLSRTGELSLAIRKRVDNGARLQKQLEFVLGAGREYWRENEHAYVPAEDVWDRLCPGGRRRKD